MIAPDFPAAAATLRALIERRADRLDQALSGLPQDALGLAIARMLSASSLDDVMAVERVIAMLREEADRIDPAHPAAPRFAPRSADEERAEWPCPACGRPTRGARDLRDGTIQAVCADCAPKILGR